MSLSTISTSDFTRPTLALAAALAAGMATTCKSSPRAEPSRTDEAVERPAPRSAPDHRDGSETEGAGADGGLEATGDVGETRRPRASADASRQESAPDSPDCPEVGTDETLELDFDGDGRVDTVSPALSEEGRRYFEVRLADGSRHRLGAPDGPRITHRFYLQGKRSPYEGEIADICGWGIRERRDGAITGGPPIPGADSYEITEARGDGLYLTGTDAAALLYLADDGWVYTSLGF